MHLVFRHQEGGSRFVKLQQFRRMLQLPDRFRIVAGADHDPERLNAMCPKELENVAKYASLDEMLRHPGLDMVTVATRHPDHVPMAVKIL